MANCIFVSNDDLERYSKELGISKLAVHATIMAMTEGKEVDSIPSPQEVNEYRRRNNIVAKATDNSLSEMASIKQKAIANGTFMKAPNGKPTNLTEGQWLQVRTKAFKDWFGDWEKITYSTYGKRTLINHIPNDVSKVIDSNGEPLVVYHGTNNYGFEVFEKSDDGKSYFFTSEPSTAETYISTYTKNVLNYITRAFAIPSNEYVTKEDLINFVNKTNFKNPKNKDNFLLELETLNDKEYDVIDSEAENLRELNIRRELYNKYKDTPIEQIPGYDTERASRWYEDYTKNDVIWELARKQADSLDHIYKKKVGIKLDEYLTDKRSKIYSVFLNLKSPEKVYASGSNWNRLTNPNTKESNQTTRQIHTYALNHGKDGTIIYDVTDIGGGYDELTSSKKKYERTFFGTSNDYDYDPEYFRTEYDIEHSNLFIASESNQIKSAEGNNGEFSREDDNIYFNKDYSPAENAILNILLNDGRRYFYKRRGTNRVFLSDGYVKYGYNPKIGKETSDRKYKKVLDEAKIFADHVLAQYGLPHGAIQYVPVGNKSRSFVEVKIDTAYLKDTIPSESEIKESYGNEGVYKEHLTLLNFLANKTGLQFEFISEEHANELLRNIGRTSKGVNSFVSGEKVYFIKGRKFNTDIAAEEMLHPFVEAIKTSNPEAFSSLLNDARNAFPKLRAQIDSTYTSHKDEELVTQALSRAFRKDYEDNPNHNAIRDLITKFLNYIRGWFRNSGDIPIFSSDDKLYASDLSESITLDNLAKIINSEISLGGANRIGRVAFNQEEAPIVTSQELTTQRNALNAAYADNPAVKRDRVQSIARKFSKLLNEKYEQERQRILDAVKEAEDAGDDTKAASLYGEYATLTKQAFLRQYGVKNLFNDIRESYNPDNVTPESELVEYLDLYGLDKDDLNDDDRSNIEWNEQHKKDEFKKIRDNFWPLAEEATLEIKKLERIIIDITSPNNTGKEEIKSSDTLNEDNPNSDDKTNNVMDKEESAPESWMNNFRSVPNITSLSQRTREALMNLYEYDAEGYPVFTDLNEMKHLDPEHAHAILLFGLANMVNSDDFEPALIKLGKKYSFVRQLLREGEDGKYEGILAEDSQLKAAFYQDFRKDATSYWSSRSKRDADGYYEKDTTFPLNSRENTAWLLASWKYNTEGGIQIGGQESLFNADGTLNKNNLVNKIAPKLDSLLKGVGAINKESSTTEVKNQRISDFLDTVNPTYKKSNWEVFMDVLHSIGIDQESDELRWALIDYKISENQPVGITSVLNSISQITGEAFKRDKYYTPDPETGKMPSVDILTEFSGSYTAIAQAISYIGSGATEGSFYHMDKTRNSYTTPNYLGRVMKELSDANDDKKRCDTYIEQNYGQFNWFKKDGVWLNSWLKQLSENKGLRKDFKHKVVLDFNKKGFFETDDLGYALGLLREFNAPIEDKKKGYKLAWYYVPMLSDTDSAEFVQFTKEVDEGYQDRLLNQMRLTVVQEYNRIKLVRERNQRIKEGKANKIANFDTRGLQFCFFPELNTWKDGNGEFLDQLDSLTKQRAEAKENGDETKRLELNTAIHNLIDKAVREIVEQDVDDTYNRFRELGVFDKDGTGTNAKFKYLKGYTDIDAQIQGNRSYIQETLNNLDKERYKNFTRLAEKYLANPYDLSYTDRQRLFAKASEIRKEPTPRTERNEHREMISKYVWNSRFATSQIEQIFATDLAYYKDATDFQKRFKEIHAPSLRLYTKAEYNGERVGKDIERSIYLADEKILSNTFEQLKKALEERVKSGTLSEASRDYILKQYESINSSDAQAYRTLDSYRAMMVMSGQWNDALEQAYKNFQSGNWTIEDFSQIFQTKKPYLYTQTGIDAQVSSGEQIKMGIQHKNSEFLLLAMLPKLVKGTSMQDAFKLRAIDQFMKENNIDVVNFTSAVKVGNQGIIDLNYKEGPVKFDKHVYPDVYKLINGYDDASGNHHEGLNEKIEKGTITKERYDEILSQYKYQNEKEVLDHLKQITDNGKSTVTIHSASYEDYGIQTQTPEHIIDHEQLFGTQIRRLIGADITPGTMLNVAGTKMTAEEWWKVYNGILVDNIAQAFDEVSNKFGTPEKIEKLLVETIKGNDRYPNDLVNAVRIVDGRFNIPLFDQSTAELVESLINSVIKDTVTKQKIKGGSCIQVSSFGLSDKLKVVYDTDENGNTHVKYMECYMPAYAKEFYQAFMKKTEDGNYILDMKDFPEELRYAIGYRVPTEDKYSMAPLKIVGFLPQQNGSAIMLPAEITTLSGSDFDVDKMYIMLPEFDVIRYDKSKAIQDFKKFNQKYAQTQSWIDSIFGAIIDENFEGEEETDASADFDAWWKENKENYKLDRPKFRKIKGTFKADKDGKNASFDDGLSKKENPSRADKERARKKRNNAIIDMMFSVLTSPDTLQRFVKPGGFAEVQKQAYIQRILENLTYNELCEALGVKENVAEKLNNLDEDELKDLASKYGKVLDPLSPLTQIHFHKQNSAGAKAIGIYAVNNAGQALLQHSELSLAANDSPKALGSISLFSKTLSDLNRVKNNEGEYITNNMAQYLAASVDNGKDPTLEDNGQNDFTFNVSNMLIRLGFRHREVAAVMNQPIIKELAAAVTKGLSDGVSKEITLNEILTKYAKAAGLGENDVNGFIDIKDFTLEDMYKDRCNGVKKDTDYYKRQFAIGLWFKNAENDAMFVNTVTQNLRADAQNAAAGPSMIDTILREMKIESTIKEDRGLYDSMDNMSIDDMKQSPLGFMAAFQQFGIKRTQDILAEYFPQYSNQFKSLLSDIMERTKYNNISVETAQKLFDATILYNLSSIPLFSSLKGKAKSSEDVYKYFLKDFPETFKKAKENNPVLYKTDDGKEVRFNDIPLVKGLKVVPASKRNVVQTIVLDSAGRLSKDGKAKLTQSWEALVYSGNDNAKNLALNLFAYSIVRYAGKYTPTGFAHLVPTAVREGVKGYIDKLEDIRKYGISLKDRGGNRSFRTLFLRNNTEDRTLFPKLSDKEAKEIMKLFNSSTDLSGNGGRIITANSTALNDIIPSVVTVMMRKVDDNLVPNAVFKNGVLIQTKGEDGKTQKQFYIFNQISSTEAEMIPVTPLGAKGNISEYFLDNPFGESAVQVSAEYEKENSEIETAEEEPQAVSVEIRYSNGSKTDDEGNNICTGISIK